MFDKIKQIIDETVKKYWSQNGTLGNAFYYSIAITVSEIFTLCLGLRKYALKAFSAPSDIL